LCIVAKSFARIFYRNAFNIGLPLIETDTSSIEESNTLNIDVDKGAINNLSANKTLKFIPWNNFRKELVACGGIINYLQKHKDFKLD